MPLVPALPILSDLWLASAVYWRRTLAASEWRQKGFGTRRRASRTAFSGKGLPAVVFKSWFPSLGRRPSRRPRTTTQTPQTAAAEHLEDRSLLSVAALLVGGELFVSSDAGDSIAIRQNPTSLRVEVVAK